MDRSAPRTVALGLAVSLLAALPAASQDDDPVAVVAPDAAAGDLFGCAFDLVAVDDVPGLGGRLLVGSLQDDDQGPDSGSVYLFELTPDGWVPAAKGLAGTGAADARLGHDVVIDGDRLVAGAPGTRGGAGRIHVFARTDGPTLLETAVLDHPDDQPGAGFGTSLAIGGGGDGGPGGLLAVGAPGTDDGRGAVYLIDGQTDNLGTTTTLRAPDAGPGDGLGWSVTFARDFVAAGAPWADSPFTDAGSVEVFLPSGEPLERLVAPNPGAFDSYGYSLAANGAYLAVGAPRSDLGGPGSGAVYVYRILEGNVVGGSFFDLEATLVGEPGEQLGTSVAFAGAGRLAAGARNASNRTGLVRRYVRGNDSWSESGAFAVDAGPGDELGIALAASGDLFAAGAYRADVEGRVDAGAVWVTEPEIDEPPRGTDLFVSATGTPASMGVTVTFAINNAGPDPAIDIPLVFTDSSGVLTAPTWTCAACTPSGGRGTPSGTVSLAPGRSATVTVVARPTPGLSGTFPVVVGVAPPASAFDRSTADDTRTVRITLAPPPPAAADLSAALLVSPDDSRPDCAAEGLVPGCRVRATLTLINDGAAATDSLPLVFTVRRGLRGAAWTCTATTGSTCVATKGPGLPDGEVVALAPGGSIAVTVTGRLAPGLVGSLPVSAGAVDPASETRFVATTSSTLVPRVRLDYAPEPFSALAIGATDSFVMAFRNLGPSVVPDLEVVAEPMQSMMANFWDCEAEPGATCGSGDVGSISDVASLAPGSAIVYTMNLTGVAPPVTGEQILVQIRSLTTDILIGDDLVVRRGDTP